MSPPNDTGFLAQIAACHAEVSRWKKAMPHILPEWQRLEAAKQRLAEAQAEHDAAIAAWEKL
jgi:hypothetical protein